MHEVGLMSQILEVIDEKSEGFPVARIWLEVGALSGVSIEALEFAFQVCREGTVCKNAFLEIIEVTGEVQCRDCGRTFETRTALASCECGSWSLQWLAGEQLTIKRIEVQSCAPPVDAE